MRHLSRGGSSPDLRSALLAGARWRSPLAGDHRGHVHGRRRVKMLPIWFAQRLSGDTEALH